MALDPPSPLKVVGPVADSVEVRVVRAIPPLLLVTILTSVRRAWVLSKSSVFVNVHVVMRPSWMMMLSTPVAVGEPLAEPDGSAQDAEESVQLLLGNTSFRSKVFPGTYDT